MSQFHSDLLVIGGGPAGLATALAACRKGMRATVVDARRPPIDKTCGEGLLPDTRLAAGRLGLQIPASLGQPFRGIRFVSGARAVQASFPGAPALGLRRTALHALMVDEAERAGVELRWNMPVASLEAANKLAGPRWIVGADGAASRVRSWSKLDGCIHTSRRFAFRQHFEIAPWTDFMEVHWGHGCEIYLTPTGEKEVCVALISRDSRLRLRQALEMYFPALYERVRAARAITPECGAVTGMVRLRRVAAGNVALVGDASGSVDAITGEGIGLAFQQATALADSLASGELAGYNAVHPRLAWRARSMARMLLAMDRSVLVREASLAALSLAPALFRQLLAVHVGGNRAEHAESRSTRVASSTMLK